LTTEIISASAGTICTSSTMTRNASRPRKRKRDTATAARKAVNSAKTTVSSVTCRLLANEDQKWSRSNTDR
jgi:hypothetical protein